ncbi:MAG: DUF971 domain-containing protein [Pseudomonadales bacterium]|nr:DUF971 domain-containing protein [Pseudomonadales bacterium]
MNPNTPSLTKIDVRRQSRVIQLNYDNGEEHSVSFELLRVYSPSAEVKGHGPGQEVLQTGKHNILIDSLESIGNYAVRLFFSDGHDSGIYSWDYLYDLACNKETHWQDYLSRVEAAGLKHAQSASAKANVVEIFTPNKSE